MRGRSRSRSKGAKVRVRDTPQKKMHREKMQFYRSLNSAELSCSPCPHALRLPIAAGDPGSSQSCEVQRLALQDVV